MNNLLLAKFLVTPVARERTLVALLAWSSKMAGAPLPPAAPHPDEVKVRLLAERVPAQIDNYVARMAAYFLQDESVQNNIREHLSAFNPEEVEERLGVELVTAINGFALRFAEMEIPDAQVTQWLAVRYPAK